MKNNEFILPPGTPLEIDIVQTTYTKSTNRNQKSVYLDGNELTSYRKETQAGQPVLKWTVPRFTIPAADLAPGSHMLTFIVKEAQEQYSTVHVKFFVESQHSPNVYAGTDATGTVVASGMTDPITGLLGSKRYHASVSGAWKLFKHGADKEMKSGSGEDFYTGTISAGYYDLLFVPTDSSLSEWRITIQVGLPDIYQGTSVTGQKLTTSQKIVAPAAPGMVQLYANTPGRWSVSGTNQTLIGAHSIDVVIPERLAGMTLTVTYEPEGGNTTAVKKVLIEIPGGQNTCDPTTATATLDVLMQENEKSSMLVEKEDVRTNNSTIELYQKPIYKIWLATAADHHKYGSQADDGEGPGVWAVDNVIVDSSRLNWDHTGLELSSYLTGIYKINYYSKRNPSMIWCGVVRVNEDVRPVPAWPSCSIGESGEAPALLPIRLVTKDGLGLLDDGLITVSSQRELASLEELTLSANHVVHKGTKRVKKDKSNKKDRRFLLLPDLRWEYGPTTFGEYHQYSGGNISSENLVEVIYNDNETLNVYRPRFNKDDEKSAKDGVSTVNVRKMIASNDNKPGTYTINITNKLSYQKCDVVNRNGTGEKEQDTVTQEQTFTTTIVVK